MLETRQTSSRIQNVLNTLQQLPVLKETECQDVGRIHLAKVGSSERAFVHTVPQKAVHWYTAINVSFVHTVPQKAVHWYTAINVSFRKMSV
jgi:hypothetical protein